MTDQHDDLTIIAIDATSWRGERRWRRVYAASVRVVVIDGGTRHHPGDRVFLEVLEPEKGTRLFPAGSVHAIDWGGGAVTHDVAALLGEVERLKAEVKRLEQDVESLNEENDQLTNEIEEAFERDLDDTFGEDDQ